MPCFKEVYESLGEYRRDAVRCLEEWDRMRRGLVGGTVVAVKDPCILVVKRGRAYELCPYVVYVDPRRAEDIERQIVVTLRVEKVGSKEVEAHERA